MNTALLVDAIVRHTTALMAKTGKRIIAPTVGASMFVGAGCFGDTSSGGGSETGFIACAEEQDCAVGQACIDGKCTAEVARAAGGSPQDASTPADAAVLADCSVDTVVAYLLGADSAVDCGHLPLGSSMDAIVTANTCAASAHAEKRPFRLTVDGAGTDSEISTTYVGADLAGEYVVYSVFYDSFGVDSGPYVTWNTCGSFSVNLSCELPEAGLFAPADPCISCTQGDGVFCACTPATHVVACPPEPVE